MAARNPPKALLFDIGGVVVLSPFQAILDYERAHHIPIGYVNFAIHKGPPDTGAWQRIERGEVKLDDEWFASFHAQLSHSEVWAEFCTKTSAKDEVPSVPAIDAKKLFWDMMRISRTPDPWIYPALRKLRASGKFVIGALSNTIDFPPGIRDETGMPFLPLLTHASASRSDDDDNDAFSLAGLFDIFVSSAHVGLRKPDPAAYELAVRELSRVAVEKGWGRVEAKEVLFLDDIGANLRGAKGVGLRTLKVGLGRGWEAVNGLEGETGVRLVERRGRL